MSDERRPEEPTTPLSEPEGPAEDADDTEPTSGRRHPEVEPDTSFTLEPGSEEPAPRSRTASTAVTAALLCLLSLLAALALGRAEATWFAEGNLDAQKIRFITLVVGANMAAILAGLLYFLGQGLSCLVRVIRGRPASALRVALAAVPPLFTLAFHAGMGSWLWRMYLVATGKA